MRQYCEVTDVQKYLPANMVAEGSNPSPNPMNPNLETVEEIDIEFFINAASSRIDSALATQYDVPLKKVNMGGVIQYPDPIFTITAILAAQMIYEVRLQGADRQRSESQKEREKWATNELANIQNGERRLIGIRNTVGSRFVRSTLQNVPRNPAESGRSKNEP